VTAGQGGPRGARLALAAAVALLLASWLPARGQDPGREVADALAALGPPGTLWGRLAVEEESPDGASTPLAGVEVSLYPATPWIEAELQRVRDTARGSGAQFETAVERIRTLLAIHQARIDAQSAGTALARPAGEPALPAKEAEARDKAATREDSPGSGGRGSAAAAPGRRNRGSLSSRVFADRPGTASTADKKPAAPAAPPPLFRQFTDGEGLFVFDAVPSGDWLVVALRITPYTGERLRSAPPRRPTPRGQQFLTRSTTPPKQAELWIARTRVPAGGRAALALSDRTRWFVGPVR